MAWQRELDLNPRGLDEAGARPRMEPAPFRAEPPRDAGNSRPPKTPDGLEATWSTVLFLAAVVRRWLHLCVPLGMTMAAVGGLAVWFYTPPMYEARAQLMIEDRQPVIAFKDKAEADSRKFVQTQVELMRTPLVLGELLHDADVAGFDEIRQNNEPLKWVAEHLEVKSRGMSEVFEVSFRCANPQLAAAVANGVMDAYIRLQTQNDARENQQILELLEQERERQYRELERLQENVRGLAMRISQRNLGLSGGLEKGRLVVATISEDERRLAETEVERQMLEARRKALEETLPANPSEGLDEEIRQLVADDPVVRDLLAQVEQRRLEVARFSQASAKGDSDPLVTRKRQELSYLESALAEATEWAREQASQRLSRESQQRRHVELHRVSTEIAEKKRLEELFRQRIVQERQQRENLGGQELDLELARAELERADEVYTLMSDKLIALRTEMRAPNRVREIHRADVPVEAAVSPWSRVLASMLFLLMLPFAIAVGWEHFRRHIQESEQIEQVTDLRVIGEIAALPARRRNDAPPTAEQLRRQELYQESVDAFRTNLVVSPEMRSVRVVSVASAVSAEGKTSLASQLAVSLARASGAPTILVDGDLRAPDLHGIFSIGNDVGLADVLEGRRALFEAVVTDWHEHLHLLPAGKLRKSPYALLGNCGLESILAELKEKYRYIVIDAPPVLSASEALIIAKAADGTVLCAMKDRTREPQLKLAAQRLEAAGVRLLGAVLAGVPAHRYAYKYGGYYYYGNLGST